MEENRVEWRKREFRACFLDSREGIAPATGHKQRTNAKRLKMSCWSLAISDSDSDIESSLSRAFRSDMVGDEDVSSSGGGGDMRCLGAILSFTRVWCVVVCARSLAARLTLSLLFSIESQAVLLLLSFDAVPCCYWRVSQGVTGCSYVQSSNFTAALFQFWLGRSRCTTKKQHVGEQHKDEKAR